MSEVKIIDIDGVQWEMKDQTARNDITTVKKSINDIQTLLSNTDIFKLNIRTRKITTDKDLYSAWSMGIETTPNGYNRIIMLPFARCPYQSSVIAVNAVSADTFDNVYIYNPTQTETEVEINLISIFKKQ